MPVDETTYNTIMLEFSKEKKQVERQLKEKARKAIANKDIITPEEVFNQRNEDYFDFYRSISKIFRVES